jgi:NADPH:quinone reductase-like Zn-dependent oxidoreductase
MPTQDFQSLQTALPMPGLSAWQGLVVHGGLTAGERVCVTGASGGVGHVAVQLAWTLGALVVPEGEPCDLLFDTTGRARGDAGHIVTISDEAPGATHFVVEPDREQLGELAGRGLRPRIDSSFTLAKFEAAFARGTARGKHGKMVVRVGDYG